MDCGADLDPDPYSRLGHGRLDRSGSGFDVHSRDDADLCAKTGGNCSRFLGIHELHDADAGFVFS